MNKQELLDEVVLSFDGKWPSRNCRYMHEFLSKNTYSMNNYGDYSVCTREEFQQRARELGYGVEAAEPTVKESLTTEWYDYTNQKALRLPPVGVECEMLACNEWELVKMIGFDDDSAVVKYLDDKSYDSHSGLPKFYRPLDHATRKAEAERKQLVDAVMKVWLSVDAGTRATFEKLYDAGFLRMPEDK